MPPSPPSYQEPYPTRSNEDDYVSALKQANKRIHSVKRKIKEFEETFQKQNGHNPNQREKSLSPELKKYTVELNKYKKEMRCLKDDARLCNINASTSESDSTPKLVKTESETPTLQHTLDELLTRLKTKRVEGARPNDVTLMSTDQVQDEKLAVQKALLQFESIHGRPTTREEKDIMRPLYDRYRTIKRLLTKSTPPNVELDLQTVPEDKPMDTPDSSNRWVSDAKPVKIPTGTEDPFTVTLNTGLLRETIRPVIIENLTPDVQTPDDSEFNSRLHQLSTSQLQTELESVNKDKKHLRKILKEYEDDFYRENGRKVQKEDRIPLSGEYLDYKRVKARLKLLEVLLAKR